MANGGELGVRAHLYTEEGDDLGFCHLPPPVEVGDMAAPEGAAFRVIDVIGVRPGSAIDLLAVVEPVRPPVVSW
jgi:hypothetical protein